MTLQEFNTKFKRAVNFDVYFYHAICVISIAGGSFLLTSLFTDRFIKFNGNVWFHTGGFCFLVLLGVYGLFVLRKKYKPTLLANNNQKDRNIKIIGCIYSKLSTQQQELNADFIQFVYQRSWWRFPYKIILFADEGAIYIYVEALDRSNGGFIDFGVSNRMRKKIINFVNDCAGI